MSAADERLIAAYTEAAARISRVLQESNGKNTAVLLRRVDQILAQLDLLTADYIKEELPLLYKNGSEEAIRQLRTIAGFGDIIDSFGTIHTEAVRQLAQDATQMFGNTLQGVRREARGFLTRVQKQKVIASLIASEIDGTSNPSAKVKEVLQNEGIVSLRSPTRKWTLEHYSSMLTRTIVAEAHNTGARMRYAENGVQFGEVIERGTAKDAACRFFRGKVVSLGDYRLLPPYHPSCMGGFRPFLGEPENPIMSIDDPRIPAEARDMLLTKE